MADLRPPIPPDHLYNNHNGGASTVSTTTTNTNTAKDEAQSHQTLINSKPFLLALLSKIYVANLTLRLGTEARFTSLVIFHRFLSHYIHYEYDHPYEIENGNSSSDTSEKDRQHISKMAAASIFLACKICNEQRRIRDIINVKHMLNFESIPIRPPTNYPMEVNISQTPVSITVPKTNDLRREPPPLDEDYWSMKEEMVRMEQTLLRILRFDVNVSHPHRILVVLWEELVAKIPTCTCTKRDDHTHNDGCTFKDMSWFWRSLLSIAWRRLNDSAFYVDALTCNASDLACAALWLAFVDDLDESLPLVRGPNEEKRGHGCIRRWIHEQILRQEWWTWIGVDKDGMELAAVRLEEAKNLVADLYS